MARWSSLFLTATAWPPPLLLGLSGPARAEPENVIEVTASSAGPTRIPAGDSQSRTAFTEAEIAKSTDTSALELLARTPNVTTNRGADGFSIRGISHDGRASRPRDALALVTVDGVLLPSYSATQGPLGLFDVSSVEIVRGTTGIRGGPHAFAGLVRLETTDPTFFWEARSRLAFATPETAQAGVAAGGPLVSNELAGRVSLEHERSRGFVENVTRGDRAWDFLRRSVVRGKLLYRPRADLAARLTFTRSAFRKGHDFVDLREDPFQRKVFANDPSFEIDDVSAVALEIQQTPSRSLQLSWLSTAVLNDFSLRRDFAQTERQDGQAYQDYTLTELTQGLVARYSVDKLDLLSGYYARVQNQDNVLGQDGVLTVRGVDAGVRSDILLPLQSFTGAVFSAADYRFSRAFALSAGARLEHVTKRETLVQSASRNRDHGPANAVVDALIDELLPDAEKRETTTFFAVLPSVEVSTRPLEPLSFGAAYRGSFRPGGSYYLLSRGALEHYDKESAHHFELGGKLDLMAELTRRLRVSANLFLVDWRDQQVEVQLDDFGLDVAIQNAARSRLYGAEVELDVRTGPWGLFSVLGTTESRFVSFFDSANERDLSGNAFAEAPPLTLGAGASYSAARGPLFSADVTYLSRAFADAQNDLPVDARLLVNAKAGYRFERLGIFVFGRNLTDDHYITWRGVVGTTLLARVGPPRVLGAALEAEY